MRICILFNPRAGSADQVEELLKAISDRPEILLRETTGPGSGRDLAASAVEEGFDAVVAAGGDGTVHEVLNGMMTSKNGSIFGVIPLGTGNDLARTLAMPTDPRDAVEALRSLRVASIDVIRAEFGGKVIFGANAASGGFATQVNEALSEDLKQSWGPLAYLIGAATVLPDLQDHQTAIVCEDGVPETMELLNVIVANGRTVAGGKPVAPRANPEDGWLDLILVRRGTVAEMAEVAARLLAGGFLDSPLVAHRRVRHVAIRAWPEMWFNIDGELAAREPIEFRVVPHALRVVVGPEYQSEVDD
jgi:diacylglycerol kinase (ATP)